MIDIAPATAPAPFEETTPIKPSEALRLGRLVRPEKCQTFFFSGERAACALGAIHLGWGGQADDELPSLALTVKRLIALGISSPNAYIGLLFDGSEVAGLDGDAAVLAYLEGRGL